MRILHLAAGNRWTGAAAPAFAEVEALREAGVDAHYAYVGGYKLEAKLKHFDFAHPIIEKAQNPFSFGRSLAAIGRMVTRHGFDLVHAHLTYDHWLARFTARDQRIAVARTFHARRVLRRDPFTRSLVRRTDGLFVVNDEHCQHPALGGREAVFTPPPLDLRQFEPTGPDARARYGFDADTRVVTVIGKLSKGRGFEEALSTYAELRALDPVAKLMIIGHGEHRPALEEHARELGIAGDVTWAGYHEDDLAEHYRASNVLLFTARGSDEGHRAVLEAMACGVVPAVFPIEGIRALLGDLAPTLVAPEQTPAALSRIVADALARRAELQPRATERAQHFGYSQAAERLMEAYRLLL